MKKPRKRKVSKRGETIAAFRERFCLAYIARHENATQAMLHCKPHLTIQSAGTEGHKLLKIPEVQQRLAQLRAEAREKLALTTEGVLRENARMAYFSTARLFDHRGRIKKLHELDADTAAPLAMVLDGDGNVLQVRTPAATAKNQALRHAAKLLRMEDRPPPPPPQAPEGKADMRDVARRYAFMLAKLGHTTERERNPDAMPVRKKIKVPA